MSQDTITAYKIFGLGDQSQSLVVGLKPIGKRLPFLQARNAHDVNSAFFEEARLLNNNLNILEKAAARAIQMVKQEKVNQLERVGISDLKLVAAEAAKLVRFGDDLLSEIRGWLKNYEQPIEQDERQFASETKKTLDLVLSHAQKLSLDAKAWLREAQAVVQGISTPRKPQQNRLFGSV